MSVGVGTGALTDAAGDGAALDASAAEGSNDPNDWASRNGELATASSQLLTRDRLANVPMDVPRGSGRVQSYLWASAPGRGG